MKVILLSIQKQRSTTRGRPLVNSSKVVSKHCGHCVDLKDLRRKAFANTLCKHIANMFQNIAKQVKCDNPNMFHHVPCLHTNFCAKASCINLCLASLKKSNLNNTHSSSKGGIPSRHRGNKACQREARHFRHCPSRTSSTLETQIVRSSTSSPHS